MSQFAPVWSQMVLLLSVVVVEHLFWFPQVRDAVAVIQLLMLLEKKVPEGTETEITAAHFVDECRRYRRAELSLDIDLNTKTFSVASALVVL